MEGNTPFMRQYYEIKKKYPQTLVLFRMGDFYETFNVDATIASKALNIALTKRSNGAAAKVPMAGFPHHAADHYVSKLVRAGHRVAICDQLEDPKKTKKLVKRGVTEIVTPGLTLHSSLLEEKKNNFLASIYFREDVIGLNFLDISTGEFSIAQGDVRSIEKLLTQYSPREVIIPRSQRKIALKAVQDKALLHAVEDWTYEFETAYEKITRHFHTQNLKGFGVEDMRVAIRATGATLQYLEDSEHKECSHITTIQKIEESKYVWMDTFTLRSLELLDTMQTDGVPLIKIIDKTITPMGGRMMRRWLAFPLKEKKEIEQRLFCVDALTKNEMLNASLRKEMEHMGDLERLASKIATRRIHGREIIHLKNTLKKVENLQNIIAGCSHKTFSFLATLIDPCEALLKKIKEDVLEEPALSPSHGAVFCSSAHPELKKWRDFSVADKKILLDIEKKESIRTGIASLKIKYNKVFGYYLEVKNTHKNKVPGDWIRKQTLTQAERYVTQELKEYEEKALQAEEKILAIEKVLYDAFVQHMGQYVGSLQRNANILARVDCLAAMAWVAQRHHYVCPSIHEGDELAIKKGRHPVIETQIPPGEPYIPNDVFVDKRTQQILLVTGPNMAGKSALLRQTALIVILAQMGSFVPAATADIGIVDKIFTRVGASDNLARGASTFMVEMTETANILHNLSAKSLVIMDEIGRGTSTYDGVSIAWAIIEYLHNFSFFQPRTLFATHYHELCMLSERLSRLKNYNVSVKEVDGKVLFLRTLQPGSCAHSFGIEVAKMAGIPPVVVKKAQQVIAGLTKKVKEEKTNSSLLKSVVSHTQAPPVVPSEWQEKAAKYEAIVEEIGACDVNKMTPIEAMQRLSQLVSSLQDG